MSGSVEVDVQNRNIKKNLPEGALRIPCKICNSERARNIGELFIKILLFFENKFYLCEPKLTTFINKDQQEYADDSAISS